MNRAFESLIVESKYSEESSQIRIKQRRMLKKHWDRSGNHTKEDGIGLATLATPGTSVEPTRRGMMQGSPDSQRPASTFSGAV